MGYKHTPIEAGTMMGRYEIRSLIGEGGMGQVYMAEDTQLDRTVAVKVLPPDIADEQRLLRFMREAKAASALNHPNILTVYEVGAAHETHFIATEFIEGVMIRQLVVGTPMVFSDACDIAVQIASALATAHAAGIVHRDIKPENIMLRKDGYVKVLDFGLAKLTEKFSERRTADPEASTQHDAQTRPGMVMGTVAYMSPEQARGLEVDGRTDIWSLGVVLYEMLASHTPFEGPSGNEVIAAILEKPPTPLKHYLPAASNELQRIVSKALTKDREERYQTVKDLLIDLKHLKQEMDFEAKIGQPAPVDTNAQEAVFDTDDRDAATVGDAGRETGKLKGPQRISSAEYILEEIKRHRKSAIAALALLIIGLSFLIYLNFMRKTTFDTVAVLPFTNNAGPDGEVLIKGLTEHVTDSLSNVGFKVTSSQTMAGFKGQEVNPQSVGHKVGVDAVLSGRIEKNGDNLEIVTELINVYDDSHITGKHYPVNDIIGGGSVNALEEQISKQIADEIMQAKVRGKK